MSSQTAALKEHINYLKAETNRIFTNLAMTLENRRIEIVQKLSSIELEYEENLHMISKEIESLIIMKNQIEDQMHVNRFIDLKTTMITPLNEKIRHESLKYEKINVNCDFGNIEQLQYLVSNIGTIEYLLPTCSEEEKTNQDNSASDYANNETPMLSISSNEGTNLNEIHSMNNLKTDKKTIEILNTSNKINSLTTKSFPFLHKRVIPLIPKPPRDLPTIPIPPPDLPTVKFKSMRVQLQRNLLSSRLRNSKQITSNNRNT